jgi:ABC-2 type transport system ATP-binding protein
VSSYAVDAIEGGAEGSEAAVRACAVGKRYRRQWALRNCSFSLPAGSVTGLVGANGAGKTTLMSVISGLVEPTTGRVLVGGTSPAVTSRQAGRVTMLAQEKPLYRRFTVADMVRFGRHTNLIWDQDRVVSWLQRFEVPLNRPCGKLSGGQQAHVALAIAVGGRPAVLLLDEPMANLDPLARRDVGGELLANAAETGMTVVLSTHIVTELMGTIDRLLLLRDGELLLAGDLDELLARHVERIGPPADLPPGPGRIVQERRTPRQASFVMRLPDANTHLPATADPRWTARPVTLEELISAYLRSPDASGATSGDPAADPYSARSAARETRQ